ncbi:MAG: hypothetical protein WC977_08735 [Anaerovoracaceae bacterium]
MKLYNPFVGTGSPNESDALLRTLINLLEHEEVTINSDSIDFYYNLENSSETYKFNVENRDKDLLLSEMKKIPLRINSFSIAGDGHNGTINSSFSFLDYDKMLSKLKKGIDVTSYYVVRTVDNFVNNIDFNLKIEECSNIPSRIRKINGKDLGRIKNVIILTKIMNGEKVKKTFEEINQHIVTYEGIVSSSTCTQLDLSSLIDMGYTPTSYAELRLCSEVFAADDSLYIPLSQLSLKSLPHLIYELGWIVQKLNSINVNVNKSWYFMEDNDTMENIEALSFHKQDYMKAESLLEERLALLRKDMELINKEIEAINNRPKKQIVKPDNNEISFIHSLGESTLVLSTKQILVKDDTINNVVYNLGAIDIYLSQGEGAPRFINKHQQIKGSQIPHTSGSSICLGNISDDVYKLMSNNKDIEFLSDYLINFLKHPNTSDPWGSKIRFFPVINTNDVEDKDLILLNMVRLSGLSSRQIFKLLSKNTELLLAKKDIEHNEVSQINSLSTFLDNNKNDLMKYCSEQEIRYPLYEDKYNIFLLLIREEAISHTFNEFDRFTDRQRMKVLRIKENKRDYNYILEKQNDNNNSISLQES